MTLFRRLRPFTGIALLALALPAFAQNAAVSVTKSAAPNPMVAGLDVTYTITVSNEGPADAANLTLNDPLPPELTFASLSSPAGWSCTTPAPAANGTITCSIPLFPPGSVIFTLVTHSDPALFNGSTVSNTATVTTTTNDPKPSDNTDTSTTSVQAQSDLGVTKSAVAAPAYRGGPVTYTIGYSASGPSTAHNATINDVLPASLTFVSIVAPGLSCTTPTIGTTGTVTCTAFALAPGSSGTITLNVLVDPSVAAGTTITNTATISGDVVDPNSLNDSASVDVTTVAAADLGVTLTDAPDPVFPGGTLTYTVTATNGGPDTAAGASVTVTLSPLVTFSSLAAPAGWSCTTPAVGSSGSITCTNASFPAGAALFTVTTTVSGSAPAGTVLTTSAAVTSGSIDTVPANNSAATTTTVAGFSTVSATKSVSTAGAEGALVTYTIVVSNSGPQVQGDNPGNELDDLLPPSLTLLSATATSGAAVATIATNSVAWNGAIPAGGSVTITIVARIKPGTVGTTVSNQATIHYDRDSDGTNESTAFSNAPGGGPTTFVVSAQTAGVPTLSPMLLALLAMALAIFGAKLLR
jgi:uncharacterized repeat protein (TIGR01451 family)